ncbi:MAG: UDP-N-acetylmuramoyl-L-alanine--D-glutamate ligase [candidate division Zixibacteria bacterium]|nr:UDP-N-acetylmuramoyl-L-alanine--D-glutamate ligase [candidate division Zixibacteria bacterium]
MTGAVVSNKYVAVLGMARSGMALSLLLKKYGSKVLLSESKNNEIIAQSRAEMTAAGIMCEVGGHTSQVLNSDFIAISPGIPMDIDILEQARAQGIPVFSEMEVSSWFCQVPIIAITGSNGKTTTTTLLGEILNNAGINCKVGGNIGLPFATIADQIEAPGFVVLEVSSFQLEGIEQFKPFIAMILNFTPDHLDRYPTVEEYRLAKARIYENMGEGDSLILNADDLEAQKFMPHPDVKVVKFSNSENSEASAFAANDTLNIRDKEKITPVIPVRDIGIPGPHNLANSAAATLAAYIAGADLKKVASTLQSFKGVEHRMEKVAEINGINYINDSKGTNVDAVVMALRSVESKVILIAGGKDKGGDFSVLLPEIKKKVIALILVGEAADKIAIQLSNVVPIYRAGYDMAKAIKIASKLANRGETVLLSPGCASFDMFENFEQRGEKFKKEVLLLNNREARV